MLLGMPPPTIGVLLPLVLPAAPLRMVLPWLQLPILSHTPLLWVIVLLYPVLLMMLLVNGPDEVLLEIEDRYLCTVGG